MHKILRKLAITGLAALSMSSIAVVQRAEAATIVSVAGDQDCFGTNKSPCNTTSVNEVIANREANDGVFDNWGLTQVAWSHNFTLPSGFQITKALLTVSTFDLEDGGAGDGAGGAPFNTLLSIDGVQVAGAFDTTFTPDGSAATQLPINNVVFNLAPSFFSSFLDGNINVLLNTAGGQRADSIAVDFAKLELEVTPVPEPTSVLGLLALGGFSTGVAFKKRLQA